MPIKIRLVAPRTHGHKTVGKLFVKPILESGRFPHQARWCVSLMARNFLVELSEIEVEVDSKKICADPGPLEEDMGIHLHGIPPGNHKLYVSLVSREGLVLARHPDSPDTKATEVEVLNEDVVTTNYHVWYVDKVGMPGTDHPRYQGVPIQKSLSDLWVFQEIQI